MSKQTEIIPLNLNQSNLQDFKDCPRRFQLTMLDGLPWPAAHTTRLAQYDQSVILGNRFHLLCYQFFSGIDKLSLERGIVDPILLEMFQFFIPYAESLIDHRIFPEQLLSCSLLQHNLIAKFDLIVEIDSSKYLIIDWKTSSTKPNRPSLSTRIQTILYPFIFHQAGHILIGGNEIDADAIQMQYWYPLCEEPKEVFPYSNKTHQEVLDFLTKLINEIDQFHNSYEIFPLTKEMETCIYCNFRSLCDRGTLPGAFERYHQVEQEDLSNFSFDLENIDEISF